MKSIYLFFVGFLFTFVVLAQENTQNPPNTTIKESFRIIHTDTTGFPIISTTIELADNIQPIQTDFIIQDENQTKLEVLRLEKKGEETPELNTRLVYFLIDASNYTDGIPIRSFKIAVAESLEKLSENDLINVGVFGSGSSITFGSDFSSNFGLFESDINSRITASTDSSITSDIFKAMYEAMDKMNRTQKEGQKILIVISGAVANPNSIYKRDDIVERARKLGIVIYTINFKINNQYAPDAFNIISNNTNGMSAAASGSSEIKNAISDFLEDRISSNKADNAAKPQYILTFQSLHPKDGLERKFTITYAGTTQTGTYLSPGSGGGSNFLLDYGLWIVIIVGLLAGLGYWQYNESRIRRLEEEEAEAELLAEREAQQKRKEQEQMALLQDMQEKNVRLQEQLRLKELELAKKEDDLPTVIPPQKFDLKNTIISGGGGAPYLKVSAGAFVQNFMLNKPTMTIGRAANNDIAIPEQTVSSKHATITIENGSFYLTDLGSTNGTFVNGSRIDKKILKSGDIIKFGAANCRFEI